MEAQQSDICTALQTIAQSSCFKVCAVRVERAAHSLPCTYVLLCPVAVPALSDTLCFRPPTPAVARAAATALVTAAATAARCGTLDPEPAHIARLEYKHAVFAAKESAQVATGGVKQYIIPTHVFIVVADDGTKVADIPKSTVEKQLNALNEAYATASDQAGMQWVFQVKEITRVTGPDMCDQGNEAKLKQQLRKGGSNALNLYITDLSACGLLGYSSWPWDLKQKGLVMDGVVIHYDTLPGGNYKPYNMGRTTVHEIGHW